MIPAMQKRAIALEAAALVHEGMAVALSAGTTTWALAKELASGPRITAVTNSVKIADLFHHTARTSYWRNMVPGHLSAPQDDEASGAAEVRLKLESMQPTGSFKTRGAHNKVGLLAELDPTAHLVTASSGNHGIAVATAAAHHAMRVTILVGGSISPAKLERLRALGAQFGQGFHFAEPMAAGDLEALLRKRAQVAG